MFKLVSARRFQDAADVFANAERQSETFNALTLIPALTSFGRRGDVAALQRLVAHTLPALMQQAAAATAAATAAAAADNERGDSVSGSGGDTSRGAGGTALPPSLLQAVLHTAVSALAAAGQPDRALALFDAMPHAPWHCPHDTASHPPFTSSRGLLRGAQRLALRER
jgi:hypothetical protein